jgi:hypothetical protein
LTLAAFALVVDGVAYAIAHAAVAWITATRPAAGRLVRVARRPIVTEGRLVVVTRRLVFVYCGLVAVRNRQALVVSLGGDEATLTGTTADGEYASGH